MFPLTDCAANIAVAARINPRDRAIFVPVVIVVLA
jgi:hypothetical protein